MHPEPRLSYRPALDGVRAFAVLAVVAYHLGYRWARGGFLGVDSFFVLSGYLITTLLVQEWDRSRGIALVAFWGRRLRRLIPALLLVLAVVALVAWRWTAPEQLERLRLDALAGLFYVANWRFISSGQSYFDLFTAPSPLRHLWSLAIEEQFYLVWPLVVLLVLRVARGSRVALGVVCAVGIAISVALMALLFRAGDPSRAYYGTDSRAHTLLVGCLLAVVLTRVAPVSRAATRAVQVLGILAFGAVLVAYATVSEVGPWLYRGGSFVFAVLMVPVLLVGIAPEGGPLGALLSLAPLRWVGRISYGVYLWHWPLIVWLTPARTGLDGNALNALRLALTFACAIASYYLVEMPIRRGALHGLAAKVAAPIGVATAALVLLAGTAGAVDPPSYLGGGFNQPLACVSLPRGEMQAARDAYRQSHAGPPVRLPPRRILVVGDSTACSLVAGLRAVGEPAGAKVVSGAVIACGITGNELQSDQVLAPYNTDRCARIVGGRLADGFERSHPDLVVWSSTWEAVDQLVDGHRLAAGTPAWRRAVARQLDDVFARVTASGARVVAVTWAPRAPGTLAGVTVPGGDAKQAGFIALANQVTRDFARRHRDKVTLIDLGARVCPSGPPCPAEVAGTRPRPVDGAHFDPAGSVWAAEWLWPRLRAAAPR